MARSAPRTTRKTTTSGKKKSAKAEPSPAPARRREILGVVCLAIGVTFVLSLWSFTPRDESLLAKGIPATHNLVGPVGHHVADGALGAIGLGAFVVALAFIAFAFAAFARRTVHLTVIEAAGYVLLTISGAVLFHLALPDVRPFEHAPGGLVGLVLGELLRSHLATAGSTILMGAVALLALMIASDFTVARGAAAAGRGVVVLLRRAGVFAARQWAAYGEARRRRAEERAVRAEARAVRKAERAEAKAERDRLAAKAREREEGSLEAGQDGIVKASPEAEPAPKASPKSAPKAEPRAEAADAAETWRPEPAREPRRPERAAATAQPERPQRPTRRALPDSAAGRIAPADEVDTLYELDPVDPLADPTHADPAWADALPKVFNLGGGAGKPGTSEAQDGAGAAGDAAQGASPGVQVADGEPAETGARAAVATREATDAAGDAQGSGGEATAKPAPRRRRERPVPATTEADAATTAAARANSDADAAATGAAQAATGALRATAAAASTTDESAAGPQTAPPSRRRPAEIAPADDAPTDAHRAAAAASAEGPARLPTIIEQKAPPEPKRSVSQESFAFTTHGEKFVLPSLSFLEAADIKDRKGIDRDSLVETARRLTQKLADFGITGEVVEIRPGPVVTMYEFRPGPGVKISKIQGLSDDLAMAMEALRVRIVAPIPGKNAVGIEVPNQDRETVFAKDILEQNAFVSAKSRLTLGMGKDIEGMPFIMDLAKMPHLLIAGTTGSGKSVSVNAMIVSMLYNSTPDEVRFIMVDPKRLELSIYEGIPHLLLPVVTDPAKAALALRWGVEEMERRYQLLADLGVRDLAGFNRKVTRLQAEWQEREAARPPLPPLESVDGDHEAYLALKEEHERRLLDDPRPPEKLPLLVIIIDELADLMMVASREVETYIARLAQMARAAGIHLMVATQRPSTDVLTGVIKANFPTRIGFRVASRHDSQTIINQPGAEKLLGMGDMLVIPPGLSDTVRVHGAFISEEEIKRVVDHLKSQGKPIYDESILQPRDEGGGDSGDVDGDDSLDPKWDDALAVLTEKDTISVSWLQRRLQIGYNRAARMIEKMEREGIVGPADGTKPREVLMGQPM